MFDPFGYAVGGESDGLRGCGFVPVAFGEGGNHFSPRRSHSGHRSGRTAQWNWSIGAGGHRARGGWKPSRSLSHTHTHTKTHKELCKGELVCMAVISVCFCLFNVKICFGCHLQHTLSDNGSADVCKFPVLLKPPSRQQMARSTHFLSRTSKYKPILKQTWHITLLKYAKLQSNSLLVFTGSNIDLVPNIELKVELMCQLEVYSRCQAAQLFYF